MGLGAVGEDVSIPWSEFGWFGRAARSSNSSAFSWFQFLGRNSVGLDVIVLADEVGEVPFQFLGRNSVGLDDVNENEAKGPGFVSIPWSEFGWFGHTSPPPVPRK